MSNLIDAAELAAALATDRPPVLLDLRFDPGKGSDLERYLAGHIAGARFVALEQVLANPNLEGAGNAPLPDPEALEEKLRDLGLDNDTPVVAYDDTSGGPSARAWWTLTWAGATNVRVLNGGLKAWTGALEPGSSEAPTPGGFIVSAGRLPTVDVEEILKISKGTVDADLVDTRGSAQYKGDPNDPRTGHIPGARNVPQTALLGPTGQLADSTQLADALRVGASPTRLVAYCGAGISSAYVVLALAELGIDAALYPGAFSEWNASDARPVEQD